MMHRNFLVKTCSALLVLAMQAVSHASTFESEPQSLGEGTVRTYVELDDNGSPTEIGVILSGDALSNLPEHGEEYRLELPPQAASTAITHIGLNWQSHGHAPDEIYSLPHFDIHAYVISLEEREAITATGANLDRVYAVPAPELIPTGYVLAPDSAEPMQGAHWVDPTAAEFQGTPHGFDYTLIYGFYNGEMTFIEPMVTIEFLQSQQEVEGAIALPIRYSRPGAYPTSYSITYNEATGEHIIALTGFAPSSSTRQSSAP